MARRKNTVKCAVSGKPCVYWRALSYHSAGPACHYCLDNGEMRRRGENGECLSRTKKGSER